MTESTYRRPALEGAVARALAAASTSASNATCVARALVQAEIDGQTGHGLSRVPTYAAQARSGKVVSQWPFSASAYIFATKLARLIAVQVK